MALDYFEDLLRKLPIFKDESKLDINFVPRILLHREKELSLLSQLFLTLITNPNSVSRKILIIGRTGIGKTATVKRFGEMLINAAEKREIKINYIHINCRKERTSYKVLIKIIRILVKNFPKRGYSPQDLLEIIVEYIENQNLHLLIVLDELSYLINKNDDLIYSLTRINDDAINNKQYVSIIGIAREISCLNNLDVSTMSTLQRNIVKFQPYSKEQLFEILNYRISLSFKENIISEDIIEMVSKLVYENGDVRFGLNLLWRAGRIAENQNLNYINSECIRLGNQEFVPFSTQDVLKYMSQQKLILLLSIIKALKMSKKSQISIGEINNHYKLLTENIGINVRSYSQIWNYLKDFQKEQLISMEIISETIKGRKAFISIGNISLKNFENIVIKILRLKGVMI